MKYIRPIGSIIMWTYFILSIVSLHALTLNIQETNILETTCMQLGDGMHQIQLDHRWTTYYAECYHGRVLQSLGQSTIKTIDTQTQEASSIPWYYDTIQEIDQSWQTSFLYQWVLAYTTWETNAEHIQAKIYQFILSILLFSMIYQISNIILPKKLIK